MGKKGAFITRTHVDVTWHARPRGRATQTHTSACVAQMWHVLIYIYSYYYGYSIYKHPIFRILANRNVCSMF